MCIYTDIQGKDNKIEGDGTKNTNIVRHRMDICAKDDDLNIEPENLDNKQGTCTYVLLYSQD